MLPRKNGLFKKEDIEGLNVPIFVDYQCTNGDEEFLMDYWSVTEFKQLLGITLTEEEKKFKNIKAFKTGKGYYGFSALYSMTEVLANRGIRIEYYRT